ncbi:GNAT family N-acetyltransferase [Phenylobacterium sp.]|uniref:GNAT family N-acetyltransferase n=1 Tax=Phenylobacterium sp. TaxID=1871053 RepID=UPI00289EB3F1|nr:GNAT family N-acetyltransferase [Phenylobacterium sp.]
MTDEEILALRRGAEAPLAASPADAGAVAQDLAAAFASDPVFNWFLRADSRHDAARRKLFNLLIGMALADGEVFRPAAGGAAAIWLPSESLGPTPFLQELRVLPTILQATGFSRLPRMSAMRAIMDEHHPKAPPHAYLWFLGVRPEAQGFGVGSRLLAHGLARVDAKGLPAYLESSSPANVPLYRRHGFEVVEVLKARPDAPEMWAMWREAQPQG